MLRSQLIIWKTKKKEKEKSKHLTKFSVSPVFQGNKMVDRGKFIFTGIPDKGQRRNERIKLPQFCNPS